MLNWNNVMNYIKTNLALPNTFIEKNDREIIDYLKLTTFQDFSDYFPDVESTCVIPDVAKYKHETKQNQFYFFDDEELDIYGIVQCYFPIGDSYISGHPPMGAMSFEGMKWWALDVFKARLFQPFSYWSKTYKFYIPNIVRVLPDAKDPFVVEYERTQPYDMRRIPNALQREFMDMCLADIAVMIGRQRQMYGNGNITTPFGDIPLNGDMLVQMGTDLRNEVVTKLEDNSFPTFMIDVY